MVADTDYGDADAPSDVVRARLREQEDRIAALERQLEEQRERVHAAEATMDLVREVTGFGRGDWHVQTNTIDWSEESYDMFGFPRGSAVDFASYASRVHQDDLPAVQETLQKCLQSPSEKGRFLLEHRLSLPDGSERWIRGAGLLERDERGAPKIMRGINVDVTQHKHLEDGMRRSEGLLAIERLASGVAHDFNNLLTVVLGAVDDARRDLSDAHGLAEALDVIDTTCRHGADLARHLLGIARERQLSVRTCEVVKLVEDSEQLLGQMLPRTVSLRGDAPDKLSSVQVDPIELQQVLVNLVRNAKEAMPEGGTIEVRVDEVDGSERLGSWAPGKRWIRIRVADTGGGIPEDVADRIFEPFFSTKETGTGLGLAMCYGIIRQSGGQLLCQSDRGRGTTFSIYLPIAGDEEGDGAAARAGSSRLVHYKGTLILVDRDVADLGFTERTLQRAGYEVLSAESTVKAIAMLRVRGRVNGLITDCEPPEQSAIEFAAMARAIQPELPIAIMGGERLVPGDPRLRGMDTLEFLAKPCDPSELLATVGHFKPGSSPPPPAVR